MAMKLDRGDLANKADVSHCEQLLLNIADSVDQQIENLIIDTPVNAEVRPPPDSPSAWNCHNANCIANFNSLTMLWTHNQKALSSMHWSLQRYAFSIDMLVTDFFCLDRYANWCIGMPSRWKRQSIRYSVQSDEPVTREVCNPKKREENDCACFVRVCVYAHTRMCHSAYVRVTNVRASEKNVCVCRCVRAYLFLGKV